MTYQPNIPLPGDLLSKSQGDINVNFTAANTIFGQNHYPFDNGTVDKGKHNFIQFPAVPAPPAPVSGGTEWTVFTDNLISGASNTLEIFVAKPGSGPSPAGAFALTGTGIGPANGAQGISSLPGGVYVQWGTIGPFPAPVPLVAQTLTAVTFAALGNQSFPSSCFGVWVTPIRTGSFFNSSEVYIPTFSNTGFSYFSNSGVGGFTIGFTYFAIGN